MHVTVLGAGSWGTALAITLARNGHKVHLLTQDEETAARLDEKRENDVYLPGFALSEDITPGTTALSGSSFAIVAVPTAAVEQSLGRLGGQQRICIASKGLHPTKNCVLSKIVQEACPDADVMAISGPNLALEVAKGVPTAAVCAGPESSARIVREALSGRTLRVYVSDDLYGVELAGALKNIYAIGAGMSDGLGFGDNTKGAFLSRGLGEMVRLGTATGAAIETFIGMAGAGDLFATANSKLSRNYRVGFGLAQGMSLEEAIASLGQVAEGVPTCTAAIDLARSAGVEVPLMQVIHDIMHGKIAILDGLTRLMERQTLHEIET